MKEKEIAMKFISKHRGIFERVHSVNSLLYRLLHSPLEYLERVIVQQHQFDCAGEVSVFWVIASNGLYCLLHHEQ